MDNVSPSWLFLDRKTLEKTQEYLASLEKEGVLDPLGLGILRDSYSNDLFPGITVLHSKIKYLFFILNRLYAYSKGSGQFMTKNGYYNNRDDMEKDLRSKLIGTIGKTIGRTGIIGHTITNGLPVIRPSVIYWPCVKTLKLLNKTTEQNDLSLSMLDDINDQIKELTGHSTENDDKDGSGDENEQLSKLYSDIHTMFELVLPAIKDDPSFWTSWDLSRLQAGLLKNKYQEINDISGPTLMYQLINDNNDYTGSDHISALVQHFKDNKCLKAASDFSFISSGMYRFFSYFLIEECRSRRILIDEIMRLDKDHALVTEERINIWMDKLKGSMLPADLVERCDREYGVKSPLSFINNFFKLSLEFKRLWTSHKSEFKELVFDREREYKKLRAKSVNLEELVNPSTDLVDRGDYYYDYRWDTAREHIYFIRKGLGKKVGEHAFNT